MVKYSLDLDGIFGSLSHPTRRDVLQRVAEAELTVTQIAKPYDMSLAAISKHLKTLEKAKLITKRKRGNEHVVSLAAQTLADVDTYLEQYRRFWEKRFLALDSVLGQEISKINERD